MYCKNCNRMMVHVMSFSADKKCEFYRCPKCWTETKKIPLVFDKEELNQKNNKTDVKNTPYRKAKKKRPKNKEKKCIAHI